MAALFPTRHRADIILETLEKPMVVKSSACYPAASEVLPACRTARALMWLVTVQWAPQALWGIVRETSCPWIQSNIPLGPSLFQPCYPLWPAQAEIGLWGKTGLYLLSISRSKLDDLKREICCTVCTMHCSVGWTVHTGSVVWEMNA